MGKGKDGFEAKGRPLRDLSEGEEHESYGLVQFSRCQGGGRRLFGSSIRSHGHFIRLRIGRAQRLHDLSHDWYMSAGRLPLIEVDLSAAQFAELLTTMNMGEGVPCTIRYVGGERIEDPPDTDTETERVQTGFKDDMEVFARKLDIFRTEMGVLFQKKSVGKGDREEVLKQIDLFIQEVRSNMPFALSSFEEATEKVVTTAKAEVEAFTTHAVLAAGLDAIADGRLPRALTDGEPAVPKLPGTGRR